MVMWTSARPWSWTNGDNQPCHNKKTLAIKWPWTCYEEEYNTYKMDMDDIQVWPWFCHGRESSNRCHCCRICCLLRTSSLNQDWPDSSPELPVDQAATVTWFSHSSSPGPSIPTTGPPTNACTTVWLGSISVSHSVSISQVTVDIVSTLTNNYI